MRKEENGLQTRFLQKEKGLPTVIRQVLTFHSMSVWRLSGTLRSETVACTYCLAVFGLRIFMSSVYGDPEVSTCGGTGYVHTCNMRTHTIAPA